MLRRPLPIAAASLAALSFSSVATAQFTESFETYTAGSAIEGQGNWQNWDVCATGNQTFNTASTAHANTGTNSLRMIGANAAGGGCAFCSDTTHELNGPYVSGQWTVTIQMLIPNNFAGDAFFILLNTYDSCGGPYGWSTQIHMTDQGMVTVDDLGSYVPINGDQPFVPDQWGEIKAEIDLDLDTVVFSFNDVEMYSAQWSQGGVPELAAIDLFPGTDDTTEWFVDDISVVASGSIGTNYCAANPNSTGAASEMSGVGSVSVAANDLTIVASGLPNSSFGFFITGGASAFVMNPGGSSGTLCVGSNIGRYVGPGQIQNSGSNGMIDLLLDNTNIPTASGPVSAAIGDTRFFQLWHRDSTGGTPTSNFTDGLEITFN